ncbi:MAG: hypothetical protein R3E12_01600 [Candidatus Eisenbacteria bacterium]
MPSTTVTASIRRLEIAMDDPRWWACCTARQVWLNGQAVLRPRTVPIAVLRERFHRLTEILAIGRPCSGAGVEDADVRTIASGSACRSASKRAKDGGGIHSRLDHADATRRRGTLCSTA